VPKIKTVMPMKIKILISTLAIGLATQVLAQTAPSAMAAPAGPAAGNIPPQTYNQSNLYIPGASTNNLIPAATNQSNGFNGNNGAAGGNGMNGTTNVNKFNPYATYTNPNALYINPNSTNVNTNSFYINPNSTNVSPSSIYTNPNSILR
jgi:hypothetical protein